ncbi:MAG: DNA polymerase III subunit delta [Candidatus Limnocylindrales bacterium]
MSASPPTSLGYYFGIDTYQLEASAIVLGERAAGVGGEPLGRWRVRGASTSVEAIAERVATGSMFGGGTLAVVLEPAPLLRAKTSRDALFGVLGLVAPGNALAFVDPLESIPTERKPLDGGRSALREATLAAGGEARLVPALTQGRLTRFIQDRAAEIGLRLGPGAAEELTKRIGGTSRDRDADLSGLGQRAVAELDKAALYKLDGELGAGDVRELVGEVVPGSVFALIDAVGMRQKEAGGHLDRALASEPEPVIVVRLHRRIRDLIEFADRRAQGASIQATARTMKIHEFVAGNLETQSRRWTPAELEAALAGLLELDATVKGSGAGGSGEQARQLGFTLWLSEFVVRA